MEYELNNEWKKKIKINCGDLNKNKDLDNNDIAKDPQQPDNFTFEKLYSYSNIKEIITDKANINSLPEQWIIKQGNYGMPFYCYFKNFITICVKNVLTKEFGFMKIPRNPAMTNTKYFAVDDYIKGINNDNTKNINNNVNTGGIDNTKNNHCIYLPVKIGSQKLDNLINYGQFDTGEAVSLNFNNLNKKMFNDIENLNNDPSIKKYINIDKNKNILLQYSVANNILDFSNDIPPMCIWTTKNIYLIAVDNNDSNGINKNYWTIKIPRIPTETSINCVDFVYVN